MGVKLKTYQPFAIVLFCVILLSGICIDPAQSYYFYLANEQVYLPQDIVVDVPVLQ